MVPGRFGAGLHLAGKVPETPSRAQASVGPAPVTARDETRVTLWQRLTSRLTTFRAKSTAVPGGGWSAWIRQGTFEQEGALRVAAVYACAKVISETIASLPLVMYRRDRDGSKSRAEGEAIYDLLRWAPNHYQTAFEWREQLMLHVLLRGNAYCEIVRGLDGKILQLIPLHPDGMQVTLNTWGPVYTYQPIDGGERREWRLSGPLDKTKILHIKGLSTNGRVGRSVLQDAADVFAAADAAQQYGRRVLENDATPGLVLKHPEVLSEEAAKRLKESWQEAYGGPKNAGKVAVLEEGMAIDKLSMSNEDLQLLESRKFSRSEIASLFRVPPHMIGDLERATFSNIEHQAIEFVTHCIRPWAVRIEQAMHNALLDSTQQWNTFYFEFLLDGLMRGDLKSRYDAYMVGRQGGWLSANDVRAFENLNAIGPAGDRYLEPLNMQDANAPAAPAAPARQEGQAA